MKPQEKNVLSMAIIAAVAMTVIFSVTTGGVQAQSVLTNAVNGCYAQAGTGTTASTNATGCKAAAGIFYGVRAINTSTTIAYLRMYNSAAATPTCSSATGFIESIPIPPAGAAGGASGLVDTGGSPPIGYATGIGFCVTGGAGNNDNTNAPAGVFITVKYR